MTDETLKQMQDRWAILMAATNPKTGERVFTYDAKYARECTALAVQIEERKVAEASRPQISDEQLRQLAWLDRAQAAVGEDGKRPYKDPSPKGTTFRRNMDNARQHVLEGKTLSADVIGNTEAEFARQKLTMPEMIEAPAVGHLGPPSHFHNTLPQVINTSHPGKDG